MQDVKDIGSTNNILNTNTARDHSDIFYSPGIMAYNTQSQVGTSAVKQRSKSNSIIVWVSNSPFVSPVLFKLSWIPLQNDENSLQINITA